MPALENNVHIPAKAKLLDILNTVGIDPYFSVYSIFNSVGTNNCPI